MVNDKKSSTKIDWNNIDEVNEYQRNKRRIKHGIPLDKPIKKTNVNWKNPNEVKEYQKNYREEQRNKYRIKHGIPLDKPIRITKKRDINWENFKHINPEIRKKEREKYRTCLDPETLKKYSESVLKCRLEKYGLTPKEYKKMCEYQQNKCLICNKKVKSLHVDHDHITGNVRGLLCNNCNSGIGFLGDNLNSLINASKYLLKYEKPTTNLLFLNVFEDDHEYFKIKK
jgi:hypothetical protein